MGTGDAPSIQAGIDSARAGDIVFALPGTYIENIDFHGKAITVRGSGRGVTTIDGRGKPDACVSIHSEESVSSVLEGFTITNGRGHSYGGYGCRGGGIWMENSEATIRDNAIVNNAALAGHYGSFGTGGGICVIKTNYDPSRPLRPVIEDNEISKNVASSNGGGLEFANFVAPRVVNNIIRENTADRGDGGGIDFWGLTDGSSISRNVIDGNIAGDHGGGILFSSGLSQGTSVEISHNLIVANIAEGNSGRDFQGGAVLLFRARAWVHHNTIVLNSGRKGIPSGGGITIIEDKGSVIEQNIIALTRSGSGILCAGGGTPVIKSCLAWKNDQDGGEACDGWTRGEGNMTTDPQFCDVEGGDFRLSAASPALADSTGPWGAFPRAGCGPGIVPSTWGAIKAFFSR